MRIQRTCIACAAPFSVSPSRLAERAALYCSLTCRRAANRRSPRTCARCGVQFTIYTSRLKERPARYCSIACVLAGAPRAERTCEYCAAAFTTPPNRLASGRGRYCSRACAYAARTSPTAQLFRAALDTTTTPDGCHPWAGGRDKDGYGLANRSAAEVRATGLPVRIRAHRLAWELSNGPIPAGLEVCHVCDNPPCCRLDHLFLGTRSENARDSVAKGRHRKQRSRK